MVPDGELIQPPGDRPQAVLPITGSASPLGAGPSRRTPCQAATTDGSNFPGVRAQGKRLHEHVAERRPREYPTDDHDRVERAPPATGHPG